MRFHRGRDPWGRDSFTIPEYAVIGSSDCGTYYDSPAPTEQVLAELNDFRRLLREQHIRSRIRFTRSGNVFMIKRWVVVRSRDFRRAQALADEYLKLYWPVTHFIHEAA